MTEEQERRCSSIINTACDAALAAGAISEAAVKAVQVVMVLDLADVFGVSMTKAAATGIIKSFFAGSFVMTAAVEAARWLFPPSRVVVGPLHAAEKTEDLGWKCARDFASR